MVKDSDYLGSLSDEGRSRLLVGAVTDYAIYMLDADGVVASWNPGARRFKGYEAEEIIGQHFSRFYTEEDREAGVPATALATAAEEGRFEAEGWRMRKDGTRFWAHVVIDPILTPDGVLVGFAKVTRDLTERKSAEEALRRSEERFRLLVESVTDYAIYMLNPEGIVSSWNAGAERFKGYTADEILGEHFSRFYTAEDRDDGLPVRALATAAAEGRFENEGWRVRKDGTRFWAHVIIDAIRDPSGELVGFAKITRDLTERRETQQALEQAREALFQSQKMEAVGRLTGGVAHDFNNLLMAVMGSLELLRRRVPEDPKVVRLLDNAHQAAQRGAALTQRMLAFARRQELELVPLDLDELVRGMSELLERSLGTSIVVAIHMPLSLPPVTGDANQVELALLNLAMNARDAMPDGGQIVIGAREEHVSEAGPLPAGDYVALSLADEGVGMDADTLARATEPFFTTKGVGKGTGLGLSMVHGLAEQSGGRLFLDSSEGKGTTAELWLPVALAKREPGEAPRDGRAPPKGRKLRILTVDDDPLVLMNTATMIEELGHEVVEARSGRQALDLLAQQRFDLLVTDFAMPQMDGAELADAAQKAQPGLPGLMVTGFADLPGDAAIGVPRLAKPFGQADLARAIDAAVASAPHGEVVEFRAR